MHQLGTWGMTDNSDQNTFIRGATAFNSAMDLTKEYRNAAIARANDFANRAVEEHDENKEDTDVDEAEAELSNTMNSFDCVTANANLRTLSDGEDGNNSDESETSVEDRRPPAKRRSKSHRSRSKRKI
jgi:hypothetical protein